MRLQASVRIETLFAEENPLIEDYRWIEEHVGALVPIEAVVQFQPDSQLRAADRVRLLRNLERRLEKTSSVRTVTSCLGFVPLDVDRLDEAMPASFSIRSSPGWRASTTSHKMKPESTGD